MVYQQKKTKIWSDNYYYLNIYKDEKLNSTFYTKELREFINRIPELNLVSKYEFKNTESFPFTQLLLLNAKSVDSWTATDTHPNKTNLITIVCGKGEQVDFNDLKRVFISIASFLNFFFVDEETDDGIENYIIWEPDKNKNEQTTP